ncbi:MULTISPECIES: hypothetical protein [Nostoc]|nr:MULTISPECIES: hypothetical protein [Nostoc]
MKKSKFTNIAIANQNCLLANPHTRVYRRSTATSVQGFRVNQN